MENVNSIQHYGNVTVATMEQYLADHGPYSVSVWSGHNGFYSAGSSGIVNCVGYSQSTYVDHAVVLVGYNDTHWIIKNSWGTYWGQNGYGYISKDLSNNCNIQHRIFIMDVTYSNDGGDSTPPVDKIYQPFTISMIDYYGDGWNGNILGLRQNS